MSARTLVLDIETAPNVVYTWGIYDQNISLEQIIQEGYMLSWSAKWLGSKEVMSDYIAKYKNHFIKNPTDDSQIAKSVWPLLDEADIIVAHNGDNFDIKWLNYVFLKNNMKPVSTFKSIDTLKVARAHFRFLSNKLNFISKTLGIGEKLKHEGFELWKKCIEGDQKSWAKMLDYNKKDVLLLEQVYLKLRPFISNHPNLAVYLDEEAKICPNCEGRDFNSKGYSYTNSGKFQRFVCKACGKNIRGKKNVLSKSKRETVLPHSI